MKFQKKDPKTLTSEMRGLLNNLPHKVEILALDDHMSLVHNLLKIHELLIFCKYKSNKEEFRTQIDQQIKELDRLGISKIRENFYTLNEQKDPANKLKYQSLIKKQINKHMTKIVDMVQMFLLIIPKAEMRQLSTKTMDGIAGAYAQEHEDQEIAKGEEVTDGTTFKIEEGEVVPIN